MKSYFNRKLNDSSRDSILLVLCLAALILIIRKTDALINPQFWAEDGTLFFLEQYKYGVSAFFRDYAGYLHLVPRVIALFAERFFPYSLIPTVYNYSSLLITLLVVLSVFSARFKLNNKSLAALAIVLVPHYKNEIFLNITNFVIRFFLTVEYVFYNGTFNQKSKITLLLVKAF